MNGETNILSLSATEHYSVREKNKLLTICKNGMSLQRIKLKEKHNLKRLDCIIPFTYHFWKVIEIIEMEHKLVVAKS